MKCVMCDNKGELKKELKPIKYKESGLDNVVLHAEVHQCHRCGEEYYGYGDLEKVHSIIAGVLIHKKDPLNPNEIRFLRTYLGYSSAMMAKLTGYNVSTISRFENGKQPIVKTFDRFLRSLVANKLPDRDYDLHDLWLNEEGESFKRIELKVKNGDWQVKLAA